MLSSVSSITRRWDE